MDPAGAARRDVFHRRRRAAAGFAAWNCLPFFPVAASPAARTAGHDTIGGDAVTRSCT